MKTRKSIKQQKQNQKEHTKQHEEKKSLEWRESNPEPLGEKHLCAMFISPDGMTNN